MLFLPAPLTIDRDAWSSQHGISRTEAKRRYISTLIETMHKYAFTTPEARELVAELEFVWDQIKSNSVSSTTSSPDRPLDFPVSSSRVRSSRPYPSYASIGPGRAQISENDLEALRPASDSNAESEDGVDNFEEDRDRQRPPNDALPPYPAHNVGSREREYEIRNRKWRKRIEQTLIKITTELAALREQIEAKSGHGSLGAGHRRRGLLAWLLSLVVVAARHLVVDALVLGAVLFWMRGDERVRSVVGILVTVLRERIQRMGLLRLDLRGRGD